VSGSGVDQEWIKCGSNEEAEGTDRLLRGLNRINAEYIPFNRRILAGSKQEMGISVL